MNAKTSVRIVVLNYEGEELLPLCLPSIVNAAKQSQHSVKVTVLNNPGRRADGLEYVRRTFPEVEIYQSPQNRVLCSFNDYLPMIGEPVAILLNNDICVDHHFIDPLVEKFLEDDGTFLVAPRVMSFDGSKLEAGSSKSGVRFGLFWCSAKFPGYEQQAVFPSETCSSGFGAVSREKFLSLKGYDDLYLPGIMEDVDLCYRAQKTGYRLYYEPKSVVFHMGQASFKKKYGKDGTDEIAHRNNFLFMWKNLVDYRFRLAHIGFLPARLVFAAVRGKWGFVNGFFKAAALAFRRRRRFKESA